MSDQAVTEHAEENCPNCDECPACDGVGSGGSEDIVTSALGQGRFLALNCSRCDGQGLICNCQCHAGLVQ